MCRHQRRASASLRAGKEAGAGAEDTRGRMHCLMDQLVCLLHGEQAGAVAAPSTAGCLPPAGSPVQPLVWAHHLPAHQISQAAAGACKAEWGCL
jgi:hypothetical protein